MYVKDAMTKDPFCIDKETKLSQALDIMTQNNFHRIPVVDKDHNLIGLITEGTILETIPTKSTSLSKYELNYLYEKANVDLLMIKKVNVISQDDVLEKAVAEMRHNHVGCLVVTEGNKVVGIITDNDIFDAFIDLLGYNVSGVRYVISIKEDSYGILEKVAKCFTEAKVSITNISNYHGPRGIEIIVISEDKDVDKMKAKLAEAGYEVTLAEVRN